MHRQRCTPPVALLTCMVCATAKAPAAKSWSSSSWSSQSSSFRTALSAASLFNQRKKAVEEEGPPAPPFPLLQDLQLPVLCRVLCVFARCDLRDHVMRPPPRKTLHDASLSSWGRAGGGEGLGEPRHTSVLTASIPSLLNAGLIYTTAQL